MRIGFVQVDGKYPNLALMQISGYHESLGHSVEWCPGELFYQDFDKVYFSKIFSFSKMPNVPDNGIIGGTGISFTNRLPEEISNHTPSYTLYPYCNYHIGFSMKGCRLKCSFCCVP